MYDCNPYTTRSERREIWANWRQSDINLFKNNPHCPTLNNIQIIVKQIADTIDSIVNMTIVKNNTSRLLYPII